MKPDSTWYKDAILYEVHVRAFSDSDGDGTGDFAGLTHRLDYVADLGVTTIWLLPFYPSPGRDDGSDIADYFRVNPAYGQLADVRRLVREAHKRDIKVVTELVCNHTSDQHPWFQRARAAKPGSMYRDFYVWSATDRKYAGTRIKFVDSERSNWTWDDTAQAYYWHRFYRHQPDLNYDNPRVMREVLSVLRYWAEMGIDGLRLDAVPYLVEREGTNNENLPETHTVLKRIRAELEAHYPDKMLLAEANQWPEDTKDYFGEGDECHMAFHFPLMPRLFMALHQEDRFPIHDIMEQTPAIPATCQWCLFLRNHDELTLEMVTDEERDYMYRAYTHGRTARINLGIRHRLAPLLRNNRRRIELMYALLFSLPGTPVIYYGDEIGMGDNIYLGDRNGVRTPMQWTSDRNAGFSRANPQKLYLPVSIDPQYHYERVNVEAQQNDQYSLLWWMKRMLALRKRYRAFGRGTMEFLQPENRKILAYVRRYEDEIILVVANLSRLVQTFELDLSAYRGLTPFELSGRVKFPDIGDRPYFLNLSPFAFHWFTLERTAPSQVTLTEDVPLVGAKNWNEVFADRNRDALTSAIARYMRSRRWFAGKARTIANLRIADAVPLGKRAAYLTTVDVEYTEGEPQRYLLPLGITQARRAEEQDAPKTATLIARLRDGCLLHEPLVDAAFADALLDTISHKRQFKGDHGTVAGVPARAYKQLRGNGHLDAQVIKAEQSNTAIVYGQRLFLKLFRRLEPGINTDLEMTRFLNEETEFQSTPRLAGSLEYRTGRGDVTTLAMLQSYTENSGDAWSYTLDSIGRYFERILSDAGSAEKLAKATPAESPLRLAGKPTSDLARTLIGSYLDDAETLGRRTAEMHLALASRADDPAFAPEPITAPYQRSLYQFIRSQAVQSLQMVRRRAKDNPAGAELLSKEQQLFERIRSIIAGRIGGQRIRTHGDYHLGQVLHTANDFVIIDFEGEPERPLSERRIKRSALRDVAGMLRSFQYAPYAVVFGQAQGTVIRAEDAPALDAGARFWHRWVSAAFLRAYLAESVAGAHLPKSAQEIEILLDAHLLEKALYEVMYELNNRPDWVQIPLRGVLELIGR
ncbi:MAG TPA: maltose alpha-D-glucosyltransferase [Thermoanaerobaculia bacterium]|nr:maltose alpha-D-glucosyltransferase [Thermoanaerobaculia bacterium]